ncbi:zf-TFIIB domain-containing protein [Bdellovibrio bacteriovorus]|uniref:TFIIB-type zinc ribbon-containing protein n=1 Tax=Bdellovibrio bacteriovorus TaxID=959 RepID=UPI0021D0FE9C|nr:zf-TFIIB domain-containing protein [Bdellovibrio bacteriovorus]UXR65954.1 zf-TFIIB domain-containing protein [Bdellovibrio bacteriovorus]
MKCPNCKEPNLVISERKGIEIDYCPECRGIWLDRGELDKIIERSQEFESKKEEPSYHPHQSGPYQQKPYKRRKSFLEELFD